MISTPEVLTLGEQPLALVRLCIPRGEMRNAMGPGLAEVRAALAAQGIGAAGPWLTHHLRIDPEVFDFEICVPAESAVVAVGRVEPGLWPAMKVVRTVYAGPFEGLAAAWGEFDRWIAAAGLAAGADLWEQYVAGPESGPDPAGWRTEFSRVIR